MLRQLIDTFSENIAILGNLGCNVIEWDFVLTDLLLDKIDSATRKRFELSSDASVIPKYDDLKDFLLKQCIALETMGTSKASVNAGTPQKYTKSTNQNATFGHSNVSRSSSHQKAFVVNTQREQSSSSKQVSVGRPLSCPMCKMNHFIYRCPSFLAQSPSDRFQTVKQHQLCTNCLRQYHPMVNCPSPNTCKTCGVKHHSLLHVLRAPNRSGPLNSTVNTRESPSLDNSSTTASSSTTAFEGVNACTSVSSMNTSLSGTVLLATASFEIKDKWGNFRTIRALLDPGSQASFIVDSLVKHLGLVRSRNNTPVFGLGQTSATSTGSISTCHIRPQGSQKSLIEVDTLVIRSICSDLPNIPLDASQFEHIHDLKLADPLWHKPGPVQMLLGADIYPTLLKGGVVNGKQPKHPIAIQTVFGWALIGPTGHKNISGIRAFVAVVEPCTDDTLKKFWEIEEVPSRLEVNPEDHKVELLFKKSHFRTSSGRFGVMLPFKVNSPTFKGSFNIANRRFLALERRLESQPQLRKLYTDFMQDYLSAGHMSILSPSPQGDDTYFIPHHGVLTTDGDKQKIRVVFDASARAENHLSLNDTLYPGPKLQNDINTILLRFRSHKIVFTCDVRQMYRQILVQSDQRKYQLIRWRFNSSDPIQTYQLNTVTYGVNSSPYLAIRTLLQLAQEGRQQFPLTSDALENDLYVDDIVCGASSLDIALQLRDQLISLLGSGGFELRKWSSNHPFILDDIPDSHKQQQNLTFDNDSDTTVKILGLQWHLPSDFFSFKVVPRDSPCTKRAILSEVARIYDPLGFVSPLTLLAKRLLQHLWALGLDWDDTPPEDVQKVWLQYKSELSCLTSLRIPRQLFPSTVQSCQLHAFCDASEVGYACVVYFRVTDQNDHVSIQLVAAKSRVAPLKRLSIPRLELCAAVLLSKLVEFVIATYQASVSFEHIIAWSDSSVALTWIRSSPHKWKSFVANRTSFIQERLAPSCWRYVPSAFNPADPASRGLLPNEVLSCSLWWAGPSFLQLSGDSWPVDKFSISNTIDLEEKAVSLVVQTVPSVIITLLEKYSSLRKIQGTLAYVLRFTHNRKGSNKIIGPLSRDELHQALLFLVKAVQAIVFSQEIAVIRNKQTCPKYLQKLSPFLDDQGILRVGGRLANSDLPFDSKHPALLPRQHRLTELLINQIHGSNFHSGVNTTMYLLQQNFWVLSARRAIRHYLSKCMQCFKTKPIPYLPPMGDLPRYRVSQLKAFSCVGVDYAGPFTITLAKVRGAKTHKAYLCLFVCFATKAVHLELASDLSTNAFLAALRRFIARRGRCSRIQSDCGTNFIGAHRKLTECMKAAAEAEQITWAFNPPSAPHFGGLWESGVKSVTASLEVKFSRTKN